MVFGFFTKTKSQSAAEDTFEDAYRRSTSPRSAASPPPQSPLPIREEGQAEMLDGADAGTSANPVLEPSRLKPLIKSIPPKILHEFTIAQLSTASPEVLQHLCSFYSSLTPPPRLHCVRCHKNFFEVENTDRSCLVPHDDESAEVEHVGTSKSKVSGSIGTTYETIWGCCGNVTEGDGAQGPPDGWCFEGFHTTDIKRARFRADSTPYDDKLTSCERLKCFLTPEEREAARSRRMRARSRKNLKEDSDSDDEELQKEVVPEDISDLRSTGTSSSVKKARKSGASGAAKKKRKSDANEMQVDGEGETGGNEDNADAKSASGSAGTKPVGKARTKTKESVKDPEQQTPKPKSKVTGMKSKSKANVTNSPEGGRVADSAMSPPTVDAPDTPSARPTKAKPKRPRKSMQAQMESGKYVPPKDADEAMGSSEEEGFGEVRVTKKRKRKSTVE